MHVPKGLSFLLQSARALGLNIRGIRGSRFSQPCCQRPVSAFAVGSVKPQRSRCTKHPIRPSFVVVVAIVHWQNLYSLPIMAGSARQSSWESCAIHQESIHGYLKPSRFVTSTAPRKVLERSCVGMPSRKLSRFDSRSRRC